VVEAALSPASCRRHRLACVRACVKILLLSRHTGALAPFLAEVTRASRSRLRIGYVTDAQSAFPDAPFVLAERDAVHRLGHEVVDVTVRTSTPLRLGEQLSALDAVYVASGSTFALLEALRTTGNDTVLAEHVRAGLPYVGASAGSIIAGPDVTPASLMDDPADGPGLADFAGLGLIDQTVIPHADGQLPPYPPEVIQETVDRYGAGHRLVLLRDDQALRVDGDDRTVVASLPDRPASS